MAYRNGAPVRLVRSRGRGRFGRGPAQRRLHQRSAGRDRYIFRQPGANIVDTVDRVLASASSAEGVHPGVHQTERADGPHASPSAPQCRTSSTPWSISVGLVILVVFVFLRSRAHHADSQHRGSRLAGGHVRRPVPVRLQRGQSLADGADHRHRIRGGRRDRGHRKHHPPHREWDDADAGRASRRGRDRIHGGVHQHLADRGVHSHSADGRDRRAPVPRVRHHAFGGHHPVAG